MNCRMNPEYSDPEDLAAIRSALTIDDDDASALGWDAVQAFESKHGVVLPSHIGPSSPRSPMAPTPGHRSTAWSVWPNYRATGARIGRSAT